MFALSDLVWFQSEKSASKILKPWWDVATDYLVVGLLMISLLIGGMEVASGSFDCLPAVDCPVSNVSKHHNACTVLHNSRKGEARGAITTVVPTKNFPLQFAKYVNSTCSKNPVLWFYSHLSLILFIQAMLLLVLDKIWLKFPITATIIENFAALVVECYNSPGTDISLSLALQGKIANDHEPSGREQNEIGDDQGEMSSNREQLLGTQQKSNRDTSTSSGRHGAVSVENATAIAVNTLYEKVGLFEEFIKPSMIIGRIYLFKAVLQIVVTTVSFLVNIKYYRELKRTIKCSVDVYIPFVHEYFICSHDLVIALEVASIASLLLLAANVGILTHIVLWTYDKVFFEKKYNFYKLSKWPWKPEYVLGEVEADLSFLLHLLHAYNELYVVRFSLYMSNDHEKTVNAFFLNSKWPLEVLRKRLEIIDTNDKTGFGQKLSLSGLSGIPSALFDFEVKFHLIVLQLRECGPLQDDDFKRFRELSRLKKLTMCDCGLTAIPKTIFDMVHLETLELQRNQIESLPPEIGNLEKLILLDVSSNRLRTIHTAIKDLPALRTLSLLENPNLEGSAIKHAVANPTLRVLRASPIAEKERYVLTQDEWDRFETLYMQ